MYFFSKLIVKYLGVKEYHEYNLLQNGIRK